MGTTTDGTSVVQVRGLAVIVIRVTDIERSVRFYEQTLGFTRGEQMLEPGVTLEAGSAMIYLDDTATIPASGDDAAGITLALTMPGVENACEALRAAGIEVLEDYEKFNDFFASCTIADPDGNRIALWGKP